MALMTKNLDQVMFHLLRVGALKNKGEYGGFTTTEGTKGLEKILNPIKGKARKNFENFAKAKSTFERRAYLREKKHFNMGKPALGKIEKRRFNPARMQISLGFVKIAPQSKTSYCTNRFRKNRRT